MIYFERCIFCRWFFIHMGSRVVCARCDRKYRERTAWAIAQIVQAAGYEGITLEPVAGSIAGTVEGLLRMLGWPRPRVDAQGYLSVEEFATANKLAEEASDSEPGCLDCGRPYPHGLDTVLTKKQWLMVNPDGGGLLCPSCIVNRAEKLHGSIAMYAHIVFGSDYDDDGSLEHILVALRLENSDYARENAELKHRLASKSDAAEASDGGC